jgi:hypothetical protein
LCGRLSAAAVVVVVVVVVVVETWVVVGEEAEYEGQPFVECFSQ